MQCSFETIKSSQSGASEPMSPELKKFSSAGTGQDKGNRKSVYLGFTLFTVCCVWEILMVFMASFMPAADVEICIGMIGVPLTLFFLSKKNAGGSTPTPCSGHKLVDDEAELDPVPVGQEDQEEDKKTLSEPEQSPMQGSCSQSLADADVDYEDKSEKTSKMDEEMPCEDVPKAEDMPASEIETTNDSIAPEQVEETDGDMSASETEVMTDFIVSEQVKESDEEPSSSEEGTISPSSKMCWADLEEEDDAFMDKLIQKQRPGLESPRVDVQHEEAVATSETQKVPHGAQATAPQQERAPRKPSILAKVKALGAEGKPEEAVVVIDKAVEAGMARRTQLMNALLDSLIHAGHTTYVSDLFEQMKMQKDIDTVTYNIVLRSWLSEGRDMAEVKALLREMNGFGLSANAVTFNELIGDRARAGDRAGMWGIISKMCETGGIGANKVSLTIVLKSLDDSTSPEEVKRVVALLERLEENVDEVLRAAAAEACVRLREPGRIQDVMERLIESGGCDARPGMSAATYGGLIKAHGRARDVKSAWDTWNAMMAANVRPTSITTGCMIEALVANGSVDDAWALVTEMMADDKQFDCINTVIYSTVLKGFAHAWKLERCFDVLAEMKNHRIQCNTITYNTLLDACTKCGGMDRISDIFNEMQRNAVEPDLITYSTLVKGFCQAGDLERAFDLVQDVKQDGNLKLDEIVYNSLLDGCARQQKVDQALEVLSDMREAGIVPSNYTLSILVKLLGRARRLKQSFTLVEELVSTYNIRLNVQVYTCLIQACLQNQKIDRALEVHDEMVRGLGCEPDRKAYSVLLNGCLRAHALDEAMRVACCAYRLPGHGLAVPDRTPQGSCPGVEEDVLGTLVWHAQGCKQAYLLEALEDIKKASGFTGHSSNQKWHQGHSGGYSGGHSGGRRQGHHGGKGDGKGGGKGGGNGRGQRWH